MPKPLFHKDNSKWYGICFACYSIFLVLLQTDSDRQISGHMFSKLIQYHTIDSRTSACYLQYDTFVIELTAILVNLIQHVTHYSIGT